VSLPEAILVLLAGVAAGTINVAVGSGTLITFPALLAVGYAPVVANVSNTVGLVPGSLVGAWGYRAELRGKSRLLVRTAGAAVVGSLTGGGLLLALPGGAFEVVVPFLVGLAVLLVAFQPRLNRVFAARREAAHPAGGPGLLAGFYACGVYGGYFGAAQGILMLGLMGVAMAGGLQEHNAIKNVVAGLVNGVAAVLFLAVADVRLAPAGLIAVGSACGGVLGGRLGRRLSPQALRALVVVVGLAALAQLVL
jgi:uncharacterized membrane protein YfcA